MKNNKRILLCGYYGYDNAGDDALASVCIGQIWKLFGPSSLFVMSRAPVYFDEGVKVSYPDLSVRFGRMRAILSSDVIVYGGGGVFQDHRGLSDLREKLRHITMAKVLGKKVFFLGISVGPLMSEDGRRLAAKVLNKADYISVRDDISYRLITQKLNVTAPVDNLFDLAVLLDKASVKVDRKGKKVLGVSLLPAKDAFELKGEKSYLDNLASVLMRVINEHGFEVRFFVFNRNAGDKELAERMCTMLGFSDFVKVVPYDRNPVHVLKEVKACSHFLGMRLHSAIFAFMASIPFVMVNYHPKCEGFAEKVGLSSGSVLRIDDFKDTAEKVLALVNGEISPPGYSLEKARGEAELSFERAMQFM